MFRRSTFSINLTAWLVPFALIWAWSACLTLCLLESPTETAETQTATVLENDSHQSHFKVTEKHCDCPAMESPAFITQERETISQPAVVSASIPFVPVRYRALMPRSQLPGDSVEHFPPEISSAPLFVRHCNFRI